MRSESVKLARVRLNGVNLNRIYFQSKKNNIELFNINRIDYKNIEFDTNIKNINMIKNIAKNQKYRFFLQKNYGFERYLHSFFNRIGIFVGLILFIVASICYSFFVWNIKIYGNQRIANKQIIAVLSQNNISVGKFFNFEKFNAIETELTNSIDEISLCSVIKKGTTIIVNIKEKLYSQDIENLNTGKDIVASQNMTLKNINVIQGTLLKSVGDSVMSGEVIVAGYFLNGNSKVPCKANAVIEATTWKSHTEIYKKEEQIVERTGKVVENSRMILFGIKIDVKSAKNDFDTFDTETHKSYVLKTIFFL